MKQTNYRPLPGTHNPSIALDSAAKKRLEIRNKCIAEIRRRRKHEILAQKRSNTNTSTSTNIIDYKSYAEDLLRQSGLKLDKESEMLILMEELEDDLKAEEMRWLTEQYEDELDYQISLGMDTTTRHPAVTTTTTTKSSQVTITCPICLSHTLQCTPQHVLLCPGSNTATCCTFRLDRVMDGVTLIHLKHRIGDIQQKHSASGCGCRLRFDMILNGSMLRVKGCSMCLIEEVVV